MRARRQVFSFLRSAIALLLIGATWPAPAAGAARGPLVRSGRIDTPVHPAAAVYLEKLLKEADHDGAALVVVGLSTPGGLLTSTREMTSAILGSRVPVATFVSPSGAQAASAGFFLLLAGDVAAMAPGTNAGAAHPVAGEGQDLPKTLNEKAEQDARAFIRTLAEKRGRNVAKAEEAVSQSVSYTETEAKAAGLIEVIARDVPDLVKQLDGREVKRVGFPTATLRLADARIETREMGAVDRLLGIVSHPNVAYVLFLLGLVGLYFELSSPGAVLPGIVGGISLLLALYAFSVLPVNLAGVFLILFGIGLFVAEVKVVSHGLLAVGGAVSLVAGSLLLFAGGGKRGVYRVDLGILVPSLVLALALVALLTARTVQMRRRPATTGPVAMIGATARVVEPFVDGVGRVHLFGEYWDANGPADLAPGDTVRVVRVEGLRLRVERRT
ncbi:MAG TPA: nodulation protein NfeD [Thermoanaerobaculia bacterium]